MKFSCDLEQRDYVEQKEPSDEGSFCLCRNVLTVNTLLAGAFFSCYFKLLSSQPIICQDHDLIMLGVWVISNWINGSGCKDSVVHSFSILEDIFVSQAAIRILLVEDNEIVRLGQVLTLQQFSSLDFCDFAVDGLTAVRKAQDLKPQVILMDIGLPGIDGIEATALIKAVQPECRILIITTQTSDGAIFDALAAGADAFCHKEIAGEQLANVIHLVASGAVWLDPKVAVRVLRRCLVDSVSAEEQTCRFNFCGDEKFAITPLEYEALSSMSLGQSCGSFLKKGQHMLQKEIMAQSQMLRKLFSRIGKRSRSICDS